MVEISKDLILFVLAVLFICAVGFLIYYNNKKEDKPDKPTDLYTGQSVLEPEMAGEMHNPNKQNNPNNNGTTPVYYDPPANAPQHTLLDIPLPSTEVPNNMKEMLSQYGIK
jgi:hypothetical protein